MKHIHCEVIKAWADGADIQCFSNQKWVDVNQPLFLDDTQYRIKPPAPKWPESTMRDGELEACLGGARYPNLNTLRAVANAAIAHACETGLVMLPDAELDIKIALAVRSATCVKGTPTDLQLKAIVENCK